MEMCGYKTQTSDQGIVSVIGDLSSTSDSCITPAIAVTIEGRDDAEEVTKPLRYGWME